MLKKQSSLMPALISLLSGSLIPLGFSPFNFWPVLMLALAVAFLVNRNNSPKKALINGFLFGMGMFGTGTSWIYVSIHQFGSAPIPLAALLTVLFVACMSILFIAPCFWLYSWITHRRTITAPWRQALTFSALWVIFEWIRSWLLTGFPWLFAGYSLLDTHFSGWAPLVGTYGLSFLSVTSSCIIAALIISKGSRRLAPALVSLVLATLWIASLPLSKTQWTTPTGTMSFSAIQGNIPQSLKWDPDHIQNTLSTYLELTNNEWNQDLIIWPENAIPLLYSQAQGFIQQLEGEAKRQETSLITGLPIDKQTSAYPQYYNGVISIGQGHGQYFKQKLVPFGEYVPLESLLRGLIAFFNLPMSSFSAGSSDQTPLMAGNIAITPYICYEVVYPDFAAKMARNSGLLITISNDTWFGKSIGPEQHFQMARMRALETGRYLIRDTNDGITALIDDSGKIIETIPRFEKGVLRGTATVMKGNTPFMVTGSWPVMALCLLLLGLCCINIGNRE